MLNVHIEFLKLINSTDKSDIKSEIRKIISKKKSEKDIKNLENLIIALRVGNTKYIWNEERNEILLHEKNISGYIKMYLDEENLLDRFFILPTIPEMMNIKDFERAIKQINVEYEIQLARKKDLLKVQSEANRNTPLAISSMVKIIVAACIYKEISEGNIELSSTIKIKAEDISVLSAGIGKQNIGDLFTVEELLKLLLFVSDNTAMDIFIDYLGEDKIEKFLNFENSKVENKGYKFNFPLTKKIYTEAWCTESNSEQQWRNSAMKKVVWTEGLDYFIDLDYVRYSMNYLLNNSWIPWDDIQNNNVIYKGGSAPGVLSCIWSTRNLGKEDFLQFLFVINKRAPFSLLEELYIFGCANKLLDFYGVLKVS
ncbi:TPA: serine hydrolase [Staphylococcus delphini]|nr:serine hydrolase [Staphylococcus delphini]HEC2151841.1 serine hydrolase [Staphylococcus delphini]HEC2169424.1 serine hydrolase [Staphylococcus delphini]HEC2183846.1 serine hydrolase [Staphylococcus delphini]HEC2186175.1 serine hydrolase [Staphylococcus delphini]